MHHTPLPPYLPLLQPGGPERPISDLGRRGYEGYWTRKLLPMLLDPQYATLSIKQLSELTMITPADIVYTLQDYLQLIQYKGGQHVLCAAPELLEKYLKQAGSPGLEVSGCGRGGSREGEELRRGWKHEVVWS